MSGRQRYGSPHKRTRKATLPQVEPGSPCVRCGHEMWPAADILHLDHAEDGTYLGYSHGSPCRTCGKRCNQSAGGMKAAQLAGKRPRQRQCIICGLVFQASNSSDGSRAQTCGRTACTTRLKAIRKNGGPEPPPPAQTGRTW